VKLSPGHPSKSHQPWILPTWRWLKPTQALLHHKPHHPAFFSSAQRNFYKPPYPDTFKPHRTIFTVNQHFEESIMAYTKNAYSSKFGDSNANCGNITDSFITHTTVYKSDEHSKIMRWLSPLEPSSRHQSVRNSRFEGVGGWLLLTSEFREWREGGADKAVLFCSGNPGVGKTYLR